jgi:alkylation response protein AidB-like acyl-CoA dehydrogenase
MHDLTRRVCRVDADAVHLPHDAVMCTGADAVAAAARITDRAALGVACDSLGIAERVLRMTVEYAKQRVQFDRLIGSFQAVKHSCTDMLIAVETARVAVEDALVAWVDDSDPDGVSDAVSMAKAYATDAAGKVASEGVSLHGGIGFTWEHDLHIYLKRAELNRALFGSSRTHYRRIADRLLGPVA